MNTTQRRRAALVGAAVPWVLACSLDDALNAQGTASSTSGATAGTNTDTGQGPTSAASEGSADETSAPPPACADRQVRVATYNIESVNAVDSGSYDALRQALLRIDSDIVCMQEVADGEAIALSTLAEAAGYPYVLKADRSPAIGGELSNGCMARYPLDVVGSWSSEDLSPDTNANDVGRDIFVVRMDVSEQAPCHVGLVTVHVKSGDEPTDWLRRQVEAVRITQAMDRYAARFPEDALVVLGDFNEPLDDPALGTVLNAAPAGLPVSYRLGADIEFPLTYQPFAVLAEAGLELTSPSQEDAPERRQTWRDSVRLDYIWLLRAEWIEGEVYNACRDDGVDAAPPGNFLVKAGQPLQCAVTELASDHFAVVADLRLP